MPTSRCLHLENTRAPSHLNSPKPALSSGSPSRPHLSGHPTVTVNSLWWISKALCHSQGQSPAPGLHPLLSRLHSLPPSWPSPESSTSFQSRPPAESLCVLYPILLTITRQFKRVQWLHIFSRIKSNHLFMVNRPFLTLPINLLHALARPHNCVLFTAPSAHATSFSAPGALSQSSTPTSSSGRPSWIATKGLPMSNQQQFHLSTGRRSHSCPRFQMSSTMPDPSRCSVKVP